MYKTVLQQILLVYVIDNGREVR